MSSEVPRPAVTVVGSVHIDLIAAADRLPAAGESVTGGVFTMAPGGKGGNQACQFARLGVRTGIVARLGRDHFGRLLLASLGEGGVDTSRVAIDDEHPTGASTVLAAAGDYASIIAPGAGARLNESDIDAARPAFAQSQAVVLQLELPTAITTYAATSAVGAGATVVLNASPAPIAGLELPRTLTSAVSILIVNRVEAARFAALPVTSREDAIAVARKLIARWRIPTVVVTLGAAGAIGVEDDTVAEQEPFPARVVDTVGAGDAFLGAFVAARIAGASLSASLRAGAAAGSLAVTRRGAHGALPTGSEIAALLDRNTAIGKK